MLALKRKNITFTILTVLGFAYFYTMSHMAVNPFWKGEITFIPLQLVVLTYITYLRWSRQ
jgi:hypothetical protein